MRRIGAIIAFVGAFIAVCAKDGQDYEIAIRLAGVALLIIGAFMGRLFDGAEDNEAQASDTGYSKTDDHNPYPEE